MHKVVYPTRLRLTVKRPLPGQIFVQDLGDPELETLPFLPDIRTSVSVPTTGLLGCMLLPNPHTWLLA